MEPDDLPEAEDLWWSWVVLAALHRTVEDPRCRLDPDNLLLSMDNPDDSWLRMRRTHRSRAVLWGRSALAPPSPPDARRGAPDWALSDATQERQPTFLAWYAHGEWDTYAPCQDEGAVHLLRPMLTVDPRVVELGRTGRLSAEELAPHAHGEHLDEAAELVRAAGAHAPPTSRGSVRSRLRDQVHGQMRDTAEAERMLMQRPPDLVRWARVNGPAVPFEYAVMVLRDQMTPARGNTRIPTPSARSLTNVLHTLHREESGEDSGAWLFARVRSDGVMLGFDRAFDSWPEWYQCRPGEEPSLEDLAWEMEQRTPSWRPAWASLLPAS